MATIAFPQARIPLGWAVIQGVRVPVEIDMEWMLALQALLTRSGGTSGSTSFETYLPIFFDPPHTDNLAAEASRAIDELRNELASTRAELQSLRTQIDENTAELQRMPNYDLRNRVEQIEDRLS